MTKEELIEKQEEIDRAIQKVYGTDCSLDGITDIDTYLQNELHTLWILKEMNRDFQKTGLFNQREFNKNGAGYNLRTWGNVMKVTAGIRRKKVLCKRFTPNRRKRRKQRSALILQRNKPK